jgi:hypothetical protein
MNDINPIFGHYGVAEFGELLQRFGKSWRDNAFQFSDSTGLDKCLPP